MAKLHIEYKKIISTNSKKIEASKKNIRDLIELLDYSKVIYRLKNMKRNYYYESNILFNKYIRQMKDIDSRKLLNLSEKKFYETLKNSYLIYYKIYLKQ